MDSNEQLYEVLMNLKSIQSEIKSKMHKHFKDIELTGPQGMLVFIVNKHKSLKISELSEKLGLSNSTVSGIVDRLEIQGLVERVRSKSDRRVVNVTLTDLMKKKLLSHEDILTTLMTNALSQATKDEIDTIASGLSILNKLLSTQTKETK